MSFEPIDFYDPTRWTDVQFDRPLEDRERKAVALVRPALEQDRGAVLDIGCGSGLFLAALDEAAALRTRGWSLTGIDISDSALGFARERLPYTFEKANVEEGLPFGDGSFDVVFAGEVIEHVYDPDQFARECRRVLRPSGRLVITTPNAQAWYNRALFLLGIQPLFFETSTKTTEIGAGPLRRLKRGSDPVGHLRLFNRRALLDLLASEQLQPEAVQGAVFHALPGPVLRVDRLIASARPSLASNLVVLARPRP